MKETITTPAIIRHLERIDSRIEARIAQAENWLLLRHGRTINVIFAAVVLLFLAWLWRTFGGVS